MNFKRKPTHYNLSGSYAGVELFLDIDKKDTVRDIGFLWEGTELCSNLLDQFCSTSLGKKIDELTALKEKNDNRFVGILELLISRLQNEWRGVPLPWSEQKGEHFEELVCRCFGVYKSEIFNHIEENPLSPITDITRELKAGGGCTSCLFDIEKLQIDYRNKIGLVTNEKRKRYRGNTPAEAIICSNNILRKYLDHTPEILELRTRHLIVDGNRNDFAADSLIAINFDLQEALGIGLLFKSEDSSYYIDE